MKLIIYITLFINFYALNIIYFPIKIYENLTMIEISIFNENIRLIYYPTLIKDTTRFFVSPYYKCDLLFKKNNFCYKGIPPKSHLIRDYLYLDRGILYQGGIYKTYVYINNINIGEIEFIHINFNGLSGYFSFDENLLKVLYERKKISNKIIIFEEYIKNSDNFINVEIGNKYNTNKYLDYDTCKMIERIYACKLKALAFASSIDDYKKNKNVIYYSNIKSINFAFFSYIICDDCILGNKKTISKFIDYLNLQFNCSKILVQKTLCKSINKIGFFVFGNSGIKFKKLYLYVDDSLDDYLYFSFHTIENLGVIIDLEKNKIVFRSNSPDVIVSTTIITDKKLILFLFIEFIIIIIYIIYKKVHKSKNYY